MDWIIRVKFSLYHGIKIVSSVLDHLLWCLKIVKMARWTRNKTSRLYTSLLYWWYDRRIL